jgi:hypothetical protein
MSVLLWYRPSEHTQAPSNTPIVRGTSLSLPGGEGLAWPAEEVYVRGACLLTNHSKIHAPGDYITETQTKYATAPRHVNRRPICAGVVDRAVYYNNNNNR